MPKLAADSNSSDTVTKYYSASLGAMSRPVAFRRGGTLHWVGADHLGGTIRVLNDSFTPLDGMRYKPYGEDRDTGTSLNTDRKFTGQTEDEAAGLYWYASRAYDPAIGRFVAPGFDCAGSFQSAIAEPLRLRLQQPAEVHRSHRALQR